MNKHEIFLDIIKKQKQGIGKGICSICSANELVLEAALEKGLKDNSYVLIESTCNQVNQFGGYTGMRPAEFKDFVYGLAGKVGFPEEKIILGGDHLGPNPWKDEDAEQAMKKAERLIADYVLAGYTKLHIDTSMFLDDDPGDRNKRLDDEIVAERGVRLAARAEQAYQTLREKDGNAEQPYYVIGTEVPVPGGTEAAEEIEVTDIDALERTITTYQESFRKNGLEEVWKRVVAIVVQPGVEFGSDYIIDYQRDQARELSRHIDQYPGLVYEAHSTDYQTVSALKQMVEDKFCILKVGPALTFAVREALFSLEYIEKEMLKQSHKPLSNLQETMEKVMIEDPDSWKSYYPGSEQEKRLARKYSLSDRIRYYWAKPEAEEAVERLIENLNSETISLTLISQFMPVQFEKCRNGLLERDPVSLIMDYVGEVLEDYRVAVTPE